MLIHQLFARGLRGERSSLYLSTLAVLVLLTVATIGTAQSHVKGWGFSVFDSTWNEESFVEIAVGGAHSLARRSDGSVVAWGDNSYGQCNVPSLPAGQSYVEIAVGAAHSLARRSDGSVVAWGYNEFGQCNVPSPPAGQSYVEIAAGELHSLARRSGGSVAAWGGNFSGQCNVPSLPAGQSYVEIAAGGSHSLARRSNGSVVAWGANTYGQCNVPSLPAGQGYVEIAAGDYHSLARRSDGSVVAWGRNEDGQCNVPSLPVGQSYVEIAAGGYHSIGRRSDGSVVAWGRNNYGQCNVPSLPAGQSYVEIAAGVFHSLGRRSDGSVVAWGQNYGGQCNVPSLPAGLSYVEIAAGGSHSLARRSDGSVVAWGNNGNGQCNVPSLPAGQRYVEIAAGGADSNGWVGHSLARRSDGSVVAWGWNSSGQCNVPSLPAGLSYVEIAGGGFHSLARRSDGSVVAWGWNSWGQCNVPTLPAGQRYVEIAAGAGHSLARRSDGSVVAWGWNGHGQCNVPSLPAGQSYVEIAAGGGDLWAYPYLSGHSLARRSDGSVVAWGHNYKGQCDVPSLPMGQIYVEIAAGGSHSLARRGDGSVVAWGHNGYGQCNVPSLPAGRIYLDISAGTRQSFARYSGTAGNSAIVRGRVYLGDETVPMNGVTVEALQGTTVVGSSTTQGEGEYEMSTTVTGPLTIRATVQYDEPATGKTVKVVNYPDWQPKATYYVGAASILDNIDITFPWPVVLQSGWRGSAAGTWVALRKYFQRDPAADNDPDHGKATWSLPGFLCFPMPNEGETTIPGYSGYDKSANKLNDHFENAQRLAAWIAGPVRDTINPWIPPSALANVQFNLVGHSMGGNIARVYVAVFGDAPLLHTRRVIALDGTFGGTAWPFLAALWEGGLNGTMTGPWKEGDPIVFDEEPWNARYQIENADRWLLYACWDGLDPVIPDESAFGIGRTLIENSKYTTGWLSVPSGYTTDWVGGGTDVKAFNYSHFGKAPDAIHSGQPVLRDCALFLAYGIKPAPAVVNPHSAPDSPPAASGDFGILAGALVAPSGATQQTTLKFDTNIVVSGSILLSGEGASYQITNATGALVLQDFESFETGDGSVYETFSIASPPPGPVALTLTASPVESAAAHYNFGFENGSKLALGLEPGSLNKGDNVDLIGAIIDRNANVLVSQGPATVEVEIQDPNEMTALVTLLDDGLHGDGAPGDGVFGGSFSATTAEGRYFVRGRGSCTIGSLVTERSEVSSFAVLPTGAAFTGVVTESTQDPDGDGLFDLLTFTFPVSFSKNGSYSLVASLVDSSGELIAELGRDLVNSAGSGVQDMNLVAAGQDIARHRVDGPWTVREITLYDTGAGSLPVDSEPDHQTQAYSAQSFEPPRPPEIHWLFPSFGRPNGSNEVVLVGSGLSGVVQVQVGNKRTLFESLDQESIRVTIPPLDIASSGGAIQPDGSIAVSVKVTTPWGVVVSPGAYTYR